MTARDDDTLYPELAERQRPEPEERPSVGVTLAPERSVSALEEEAMDALRDEVEALQLGSTLGEGGMGLVRLGVQRRLGREVAVKTLRAGANRRASLGLLREAWITGSLEHPNIVPIYDVTLDRDGLPRIVLKRIEGTCWTDLLDDPRLLEPAHRADPVARHLDVLIAVCHAVEFAHDRQILHRDLKPDNVMLGRFGEVYLLDWGIAASLEDRGDGRFPLARDQRMPTGTPIYMAPEMALGDGEALCPETDVFLLTGLLFRVLAGRPPRMGNSLAEVLDQVREPIPLDERWPEDLRALLTRGFDLDPQKRPSARAFREALELHLRGRETLALLQRARDRIAELDALLARTAPDRMAVYDRFGACRFGVQEVLARWPEHQEAGAALRGLLLTMVRYELDQGDPRAARVLLADVSDPPEDALTRIAYLERAIAADAARLAQLSVEVDPVIGARTRLAVLGAIALIWAGAPTLLPFAGIEPGYPRAIGVAIGQFVGTAVVLRLGYKNLVRTRVNQVLFSLMLLEPILNLPLLFASRRWGLHIDQATVLELLLGTTLVSVGALLVDRRVLVSAAAFFGASLLAIWDPTRVRDLVLVCVIVLVVNAGWAWRRPAS